MRWNGYGTLIGPERDQCRCEMVMAVRTVARRRLGSITEVALYTDAKIEKSECERDLLDGVDHEREREDR
jgi:hypothetical protein